MPPFPELVRRLRVPGAPGADDADLLLRFAEQRDEAAFELLVWRHGGMVLATCRRILGRSADADDAFQITFLTLARRAGSIRTGAALPGWLHRVARRAAEKVKSAVARRPERTGGELPEPATEPTVPDDLKQVLDEEIDRLPEKLRRAFVLCHLEGVTNESAAERLGCPRGTVLSRLSRAREQLRDRLTRRGVVLSALPAISVAALPTVGAASTARAAVAFVNGSGPIGVSTRAVAITHGILRSMRLTQLRPLVLALFAVAGVGFAAVSRSAERPTAPDTEAAAVRYAPASDRGNPGSDPKKNEPDGAKKPGADFTGAASATGTHKRPLLIVGDKRYELKASDKADASVAEALAKISKGDTGTYTAKGVLGTVNGNDGIIVDSIAPAAKPPAGAPTAPTVTSSVVTVGSRKYTVYEYADPATKKFCVVIPEGLKTVRGLLVECNYSGGDSRKNWTFCHYYREFMHLHDFGLVASAGDIPHVKAFAAFRDCLQKVGAESRRPELVHAPYVAVGFSSGGGFASTLSTMDPEKTIAAGIIEARYNFTKLLPPNPPPAPAVLDATLAIPSVLFVGGKHNPPDIQTGTFKMVDEVFVPFRPKGARYAWLVLPGYGHEYAENRQDLLAMPLLDAAVRARYPKDGDVTKGPIKLLTIDPSTGWVADNTTWKSGLTKIVPTKEFKGDLGHSSWLQNEDIAFIYRAYATHNNPLTITAPKPCGPGTPALDPGSDVTITVDTSKFPKWNKLEFYGGAKKLGTVTEAPARFTAKNLAPGYHVFSVLATDDKGTVRTSDPVMVVVRK